MSGKCWEDFSETCDKTRYYVKCAVKLIDDPKEKLVGFYSTKTIKTTTSSFNGMKLLVIMNAKVMQ